MSRERFIEEGRGYLIWRERETEYREDHAFLAFLSEGDWYELYLNPEKCNHLIANVMREEESERYDGGDFLRSETKIIFLIGSNLADETNFDGSPVRRKPSEYAKASEYVELLGTLSGYIEENNRTPEEVYSELADFFWNLGHLTATDSEVIGIYERMMEQLSVAAGLTVEQAMLLVIVKYQRRLYYCKGEKNVEMENGVIATLRFGIPSHVGDGKLVNIFPKELSKKTASNIFTVLQMVIEPNLQKRLDMLKNNYWLEEYSKSAGNTSDGSYGDGSRGE